MRADGRPRREVGADRKQGGEESREEHQLATEPDHHSNGQHRGTIVNDLLWLRQAIEGNRLTHAYISSGNRRRVMHRAEPSARDRRAAEPRRRRSRDGASAGSWRRRACADPGASDGPPSSDPRGRSGRVDDDDRVELEPVGTLGREDHQVGAESRATPGPSGRSRRGRSRRRTRPLGDRSPATMTATRPGATASTRGASTRPASRRSPRGAHLVDVGREAGAAHRARRLELGRGGARASAPRSRAPPRACGSSPSGRRASGARRGSSTSSTAFHDADEDAVVAWPMSPTMVIEPVRSRRLQDAQLHRREVLGLVDHDVAVGHELGLVELGACVGAWRWASRSAAARTSPCRRRGRCRRGRPIAASTGGADGGAVRAGRGPRRSARRRPSSTRCPRASRSAVGTAARAPPRSRALARRAQQCRARRRGRAGAPGPTAGARSVGGPLELAASCGSGRRARSRAVDLADARGRSGCGTRGREALRQLASHGRASLVVVPRSSPGAFDDLLGVLARAGPRWRDRPGSRRRRAGPAGAFAGRARGT